MRHPATLRAAIARRLPRSSRRRRLVALLAAAALAAVIAWAIATQLEGRPGNKQPGAHASTVTSGSHGAGPGSGSSGGSLQLSAPPHGSPATVTVDAAHPGAAVPSDFLGLSFEAAAVPAIAADARAGNLAELLRSLGQATLRIGGVSADARVGWSLGGAVPHWARGAISRQDLAGLASLARATGWKVLLTVNLGHYEPARAAAEAAAAHALLGGHLAGIEIGNEPDRFPLKGLRGPGWSFSAYRRELETYRAAIAGAAPGVPVAGPDASSGERVLPWLRATAALRPGLLTDHYYPLSACGSTPVLSELLSPTVRREESSMLASLHAIQSESARPLYVDETNNISCKGQAGVSNTFASALWAVDYVARAMAAGLRGLDFHDLLSMPGAYSPLVGTTDQLRANPEWYALLLSRQLEGAKPLQATVLGSPNLTARAFLSSGGTVRLVFVNFAPPGATPLLVRLKVPGRFTGGTVLRLTAPSPDATSHVLLGGREVTASGALPAPSALRAVYQRGGALALTLPPSSAALVSLRPTRAR